MRKNVMIIALLAAFVVSLVWVPGSDLLSADTKTDRKGYLGVSIEPLTRQTKKELKAEFGVVIASIEEDSPADKDGLMEDDVIQQVNDVKIRRPSTLSRTIRKIKPGDTAKIVVVRDGKEKSVKVTIEKLKERPGLSAAIEKSFNALRFLGGRTYLGVQLHQLNNDLADYFGVKPDAGVLVLEVEDDSPAEKAGIKAGDIITKADDETVASPEDIHDILSELYEDDEIAIELIQKGKKKTVKAIIEKTDHSKGFYYHPSRDIRHLEIIPRELNRLKRIEPHIRIERNLPEKNIEIQEKAVHLIETI